MIRVLANPRASLSRHALLRLGKIAQCSVCCALFTCTLTARWPAQLSGQFCESTGFTFAMEDSSATVEQNVPEWPPVLQKILAQFEVMLKNGNVGQQVADRTSKSTMKKAGVRFVSILQQHVVHAT